MNNGKEGYLFYMPIIIKYWNESTNLYIATKMVNHAI